MKIEAGSAHLSSLSAEELHTEVAALYSQQARALRVGLRRLTGPSADVDDLLHEVFVIALRRPAALLAAESPRAWLYGIAVKVAAAARRRTTVRAFLGLDSARAVSADAPDPDARLDAARRIERALGKLGRKKREVLVLFELQGLSGDEIAAALGVPESTVFTRLHHARKDLERLMVDRG